MVNHDEQPYIIVFAFSTASSLATLYESRNALQRQLNNQPTLGLSSIATFTAAGMLPWFFARLNEDLRFDLILHRPSLQQTTPHHIYFPLLPGEKFNRAEWSAHLPKNGSL